MFSAKIAWIMVALMPFLFISCSDSDDQTDYSLEGTWEGSVFTSAI